MNRQAQSPVTLYQSAETKMKDVPIPTRLSLIIQEHDRIARLLEKAEVALALYHQNELYAEFSKAGKYFIFKKNLG